MSKIPMLSLEINQQPDEIMKDLQANVKKKLKELKQIEKDAAMHRFSFLQKKINKAREDSDLKQTKILKNIYHSELRRMSFKKITPIIKGTSVSTLDKFIVEGNSKRETKIITDHLELHATLMEQNKNILIKQVTLLLQKECYLLD